MPETVRLSLAAAMTLGLRSGRSYRDARTGCVNLLLDYPTSCLANCAYCGLSKGRDRPADDNGSFIRVDWPIEPTATVVERIAARPGVTRVCLSMVENRHAFVDTLALCDRVRAAAPHVPISVLVHPRPMDEERFAQLRDAGADHIGVGLDAATPAVFARHRPGLDWEHYRRTISVARRVFGPHRVNAHLVVGLGETDRELLGLVDELAAEQVDSYLFCFNPEPGTRLARRRRPTMVRWRRVQLAVHLLQRQAVTLADIAFDGDSGAVTGFACPPDVLRAAVASGLPFRTHGCPDAAGEATCNRPFGSYRPGESFRDYPFAPEPADTARITRELRLPVLTASSST